MHVREVQAALAPPTPVYRQRYEPPLEPAPVFERRIASQQASARQKDIEHQMNLLAIHHSNAAHYRSQARYFGSLDAAPPMTRHGLQEAYAGIAQIKEVLRGYGVDVQDLAGDE
jgi:hypothetical protein